MLYKFKVYVSRNETDFIILKFITLHRKNKFFFCKNNQPHNLVVDLL